MKSRDKHDRVGCKQRAFEYSEILRFLVTQPGRRSIHRSIVPQDRGGDCRSAGQTAIKKKKKKRKGREKEIERASENICVRGKRKRKGGKKSPLIHRRNLLLLTRNLSFQRLSLLYSHAFRSSLRAIQLFLSFFFFLFLSSFSSS